MTTNIINPPNHGWANATGGWANQTGAGGSSSGSTRLPTGSGSPSTTPIVLSGNSRLGGGVTSRTGGVIASAPASNAPSTTLPPISASSGSVLSHGAGLNQQAQSGAGTNVATPLPTPASTGGVGSNGAGLGQAQTGTGTNAPNLNTGGTVTGGGTSPISTSPITTLPTVMPYAGGVTGGSTGSGGGSTDNSGGAVSAPKLSSGWGWVAIWTAAAVGGLFLLGGKQAQA